MGPLSLEPDAAKPEQGSPTDGLACSLATGPDIMANFGVLAVLACVLAVATAQTVSMVRPPSRLPSLLLSFLSITVFAYACRRDQGYRAILLKE